jgi:GTPase SAR1 family protein
MGQYKLLFTGPVGAGKTTAIASLSDEAPIKTDVVASDMTRRFKPETTVALDYGVMRLPAGGKLHLYGTPLYGTPGQERFDFMWEILTTGGVGLIVLLRQALLELDCDNKGQILLKQLGFGGWERVEPEETEFMIDLMDTLTYSPASESSDWVCGESLT